MTALVRLLKKSFRASTRLSTNGKFSLLARRAGKNVLNASSIRLELFDGVYPDEGRAQDRLVETCGEFTEPGEREVFQQSLVRRHWDFSGFLKCGASILELGAGLVKIRALPAKTLC